MIHSRAVWCGSLVAVALTLGACPAKQVTFVPAEGRTAGLPDDVTRLVEISDSVAASHPQTPAEADRGLAAVEKALELGPEHPYEVLWRLSRDAHTMADLLTVPSQKETYARRGRKYGEQATQQEGSRVEGWYYTAVNIARVAEATSQASELGEVVKLAQKAADIDASYDEAAPLRLLGKVYMVAPEWPTSVGDRDKAVEVLKRAVALSATPLNRLFLGEALYHAEEHEAAVGQLRRALKDGEGGGLEARWVDEAKDYLRRLGER
ncbi:MAG: hypothetical protein H6746_19830 [Deltaproteobacteria bacterium]|nr:hypothetical protein [Deltaproteobacteria bacterium]